MRRTFVCLLSAAVAVGAVSPPVIGSRIAIVPVDVRVVDRNGNPVTGLKQDDFTILEDGVPQAIRHFEVQTLTPDPRAARAPVELMAPGEILAAQPRRVFLLLLGRGYMAGPSKELEALQVFVRERLLPQDLVAVLAFNRATGFTTDHTSIAGLIERYRAAHMAIEKEMAGWNNGLRGMTGNTSVPPGVQARVDSVFGSAESLRAREHIEKNVSSSQDVANMYAGIEYMRFIDGEKHLVLITPRGLNLPRLEHERSIAAAAADSRVAISALYTAGSSSTSGQTFGVESLLLLSEITGGHTTVFRYGDYALNRLDVATRSQYLIGYSPPGNAFNGTYRRISVEVKRKDVDVMYRRGYFARDRTVPLDKREFMAFTQISRAAGYAAGDIHSLMVKLDAPRVVGSGNARELLVQVRIGPERIRVADENGVKVVTLDIALFAFDKDGNPYGEAWQKIDLKLTPEAHQRFLKEGTTYAARVPLTNYPNHLKAVLYNFTSDLLGTASTIVY